MRILLIILAALALSMPLFAISCTTPCVQYQQTTGTTQPLALAMDANIANGALVVVGAFEDGCGTITAVSDTLDANAWTLHAGGSWGGTCAYGRLASKCFANGGALTVNVSSSTAAHQKVMTIIEFTGVTCGGTNSSAGILDGAPNFTSCTSSCTTALTGTAVTTSNATDLLVAAGGKGAASSTVTAGSGYGLIGSNQTTSSGNGRYAVEYRTTTSSGSYSGIMGFGVSPSSSGVALAIFKTPAGAASKVAKRVTQ
jgi:hypothetical protein